LLRRYSRYPGQCNRKSEQTFHIDLLGLISDGRRRVVCSGEDRENAHMAVAAHYSHALAALEAEELLR
jgi:hypothetical protein